MIRNLSECAFQYSSETTSVWHLKRDQYKACPSIKAPQRKNSIIVLPISSFPRPKGHRRLQSLDLGHAAIDVKLCARDITGLIGREE